MLALAGGVVLRLLITFWTPGTLMKFICRLRIFPIWLSVPGGTGTCLLATLVISVFTRP